MKRIFLSHSSSDKEGYVRVVAHRIGKETIGYDEWTFEEGERTSNEIKEAIEGSAIFALFISARALESKWVLDEISLAKKQLDAAQLRKIYPVIVEKGLTHDDPRIPKWLREEYNLKFISRPSVAARRLISKLRELQWTDHPEILAREQIFVGRNELLSEFERRFDDIDLKKPFCIIASGLNRIGRSRFLHHALIKSSVVKSSFKPVKIVLSRVDSIEDLILKIFDTGLTGATEADVEGLIDKTLEQKEIVLAQMFNDLAAAREVLFIEDSGCLVTHERTVVGWLLSALERATNVALPIICVAASYRTRPDLSRANHRIYAIELPELSPRERSGLLKRLLDISDVNILPDDFHFFSEQLRGFPDEAQFCASLIAEKGVDGAKRDVHELTEFNTERASVLLRQYESDSKAKDFIYLLSEFEFVATSLIFEIVSEAEYSSILDDLIARLICDYLGEDREYVRINDSVRDFIRRNRLTLPGALREKLRNHVEKFVGDTNKFDRDASDFFYSIKEALLTGEKIDSRYLAPSHYLRTIRDLYHRRENLKRVVLLADHLLERESSLDLRVSQDVRYYLCLALARQKDKRLLREAQHIHGPEHDFVLGYYYRLVGRHADAIERLSKLTDTKYIAQRARRELVQVYLYIEEFDKASVLAKESYLANRGNQFFIQSYLNSLLLGDNAQAKQQEIVKLIGELEQIGSTQSQQMTLIAKANFEAKVTGDRIRAKNFIEDAVALDVDSVYPHLARFDIALRFVDMDGMWAAIEDLERLSKSRAISRNTLTKNKAYFYAAKKDPEAASKALEEGLENYPAATVERIRAKVLAFARRP